MINNKKLKRVLNKSAKVNTKIYIDELGNKSFFFLKDLNHRTNILTEVVNDNVFVTLDNIEYVKDVFRYKDKKISTILIGKMVLLCERIEVNHFRLLEHYELLRMGLKIEDLIKSYSLNTSVIINNENRDTTLTFCSNTTEQLLRLLKIYLTPTSISATAFEQVELDERGVH